MRDVVTWILVGAGVALQVFMCAGVVLMRDALDRLHYVGGSAAGIACLCAAVVVAEGPSLIGIKAVLIAAFLLVTGPVMAHATARAIQLHWAARE